MGRARFYLASKITDKQRNAIQAAGMAYFPEIFGEAANKYTRFVVWMAEKYKVVSPSTRDLFSAGGRGDLGINGKMYYNVPHILITAYERRKELIDNILNTPEETLCKHWGVEKIEENRLAQWVDCITRKCEIFGIRRILEGLIEVTLAEKAKEAEPAV